jgi:TrmH family RNA methyltransferase
MDFMPIESVDNKKIKLAASLHQRKNREKEGLFLAEGVRLCEMVAESSWKIKFALVTDALLATERGKALADKLAALTEVCRVMEKIFLKAAATEQPQVILLSVEQQKNSLLDLQAE